MRLKLVLFLVAVAALTACDSYIEEARVQGDGTVEFAAQAIVVCTDPLQQEIWGGDPCDAIDAAVRSGDVGDPPFGFELDPDRVSLVGTGEADRRTIDVLWNGTIDELSTVLVSSGTIRELDAERTEVVFTPAGAPADQLRSSTDAGLIDALRVARWAPGEFRVKTPDLVVEHNGDDIRGRLVIWNVDDDHPDEFRVVWSSADPPRRWWAWAIAAVVLSGVLILMVTIEGPAQNRRKKPPA